MYQKSWSYAILFLKYMACDRCNYFSFWTIFCFFTHLTAQKIKKFSKKWKNAWRYHHFTYVYQKLWSNDVQFLRHGVQQMDRQTDRQKKWHIEVGAPSKNNETRRGRSERRKCLQECFHLFKYVIDQVNVHFSF